MPALVRHHMILGKSSIPAAHMPGPAYSAPTPTHDHHGRASPTNKLARRPPATIPQPQLHRCCALCNPLDKRGTDACREIGNISCLGGFVGRCPPASSGYRNKTLKRQSWTLICGKFRLSDQSKFEMERQKQRMGTSWPYRSNLK